MTKLLYQGHASLRLTGNDGRVIYVDPFAGSGYVLPASLILVTHDHRDHNKVDLCPQAPGCRVITSREALAGGTHHSFDVDGVTVEAVEAKNLMHSPKRCVGYLIDIDGVRLYISGDTSKTSQMPQLAQRSIDYAFFCGDGLFNMGPREAAECARLVAARHNCLYHMRPGALFDAKKAQAWTAPNKLIIEAGQEIELTAG